MKIEELPYNDKVKKLLFDLHTHDEDGAIVYNYENVLLILGAINNGSNIEPRRTNKPIGGDNGDYQCKGGGDVKPC